MKFSEIDEGRRLWTIPAARAKNGRAHAVPLSEQAWRVLTSVPRIAGCDYVFTLDGRVPVNAWGRVKTRLCAKAGIDPANFRLHDLRRSAVVGLQSLGVPMEVIARVLNHTVRGPIRAYAVHDYRDETAHALQRWANRVEEIAGGKQPVKVVKLR